MKKIMLMAAMLVAVVSAKAQFEPGTFSIQPKIGFSGATMTNIPNLHFGKQFGADIKMDNTPIAGFVVGGEFEYQLTKRFSVAAGLGYSLQGSGWEDYEIRDGSDYAKLKDARIELGYLTVPVVANVYLFKGFALKAGVQLGMLTNAKVKAATEMEIEGRKQSNDDSKDIKDRCNKMDVSIPVGVSYQFPGVPIVIDGRFNIGVTDVFKKEELDGQKNSQNVVFQMTVGYKFAL